MIRRFALSGTLALVGILALAATAAAAIGPEWKLTVTPNADYVIPGQSLAVYKVEAENVGDEATHNSEQIKLEGLLPAGLEADAVRFYAIGYPPSSTSKDSQDIGGEVCSSTHVCKYPRGAISGLLPPVAPEGGRLIMTMRVPVPAEFSGPIEFRAKISGGGAPAAQASATNEANPEPPFGKLGFEAFLTDSSNIPFTQAGGHPYQFVTDFHFATYSSTDPHFASSWDSFSTSPLRDPKQLVAELPPGLIANPQGVPHCTLAHYFGNECEISDVVGFSYIHFFAETEGGHILPVFNLQPQGAYPGELGINVAGSPLVVVTTGLRTATDYGVTATSVVGEADLTRARVTLWGVPADPSHDKLRGKECGLVNDQLERHRFARLPEEERKCEESTDGGGFEHGGPAGVPPTPFFTMPTRCSGQPLPISGRYDTWLVPSEYAERDAELEAVDGCNQLSFEPTIEARPTTNLADAPSGFDFHLKIPQHEDCAELPAVSCEEATPTLKEAVVKLPPGLVVNPSSGQGLVGCSPAQIGLITAVGATPAHFSGAPAECPAPSRLGSVEVETPLLQNPLEGSVFLATPHQNPSGNLLAGYIVLEGEGIVVKLAGQFQTDPNTGQITASFLENPQTPFEDFRFHFFGGALGALRTPPTCGTFTTTSTLTPWSAPESGPPAEPADHFETTGPASGSGACPSSPGTQENAPRFHAGTESPQAGAFSPFSLRLVREDGSQELSKIDTTLPPGLVGKLAGVGECSDAQLAVAQGREHEGGGAEEQASPSCPSNTEVGTVDVGAGAGPTPLHVTGHAYLAGPYKSAPLSLAIITPAVAGPFDLGTVVVRTALNVDPFTAQIHAVSDEIPHILAGIPLDVRSVTLKMARPNFTLNPTNCEPLGFTGAALSVLGTSAPLTQRFQVGGCNALPFKPKLSLRLKGSPKRAKFPALTATLTMPPGDANVASAQVTLPHSSFLSQGHIAKTCGRPELASHTCPAASIYGHANAVTPLLDHPLEGPVYLATGFGYQLPALVADLNGQIEVLLKGKVDSGRGDGIRNTFEVVPDAPVSKFTLHMFGGKKSLIENSQYLCSPRAKTKALARFTGQNGKVVELEPTVKNSCKHKKGKKGKGGSGHHKRHGG